MATNRGEDSIPELTHPVKRSTHTVADDSQGRLLDSGIIDDLPFGQAYQDAR